MQLYENKSNSAMESGDHFKNGASLKSLMSNGIKNMKINIYSLSIIFFVSNYATIFAQNKAEKVDKHLQTIVTDSKDSCGCDNVFYERPLRYGYQYPFFLNYRNSNTSADLYVWSVKVEFIEQYDYNQDDNPVFHWVNVNEGKPKIIPPNSYIHIIESDKYAIKAVPFTRSYDNLLIKYTIVQSIKKNGSDKKTHVDCAYYAISWCGDGVIDDNLYVSKAVTIHEECDDGNKIDDDGCDCNCKKNH